MKTSSTQTATASGVSKAEPAIEVRAVQPEELARFERLLKDGH